MRNFKAPILLTALVCYGCCQPRASEIGTNHVAVLSVTRWDDYEAELQPQFNLSADQALAASIPDTLQLEQALSHSFQAALALKLAPSAALPAGFGTGQSGEGLTAKPTTAPATSQPASVIDKGSLKSDPYLQYLAATALYQEVKLINRYVRDAAVPADYRAYVVRMQVSSLPKARHQPYDTYVDVSLFLDPFEQPVSSGSKFQQAATQRDFWKTSMPPKLKPYGARLDELLHRAAAAGSTGGQRELCSVQQSATDLRDDLVRASGQFQHDANYQRLLAAVREALKSLGTAGRQVRPHLSTPVIVPLLVTDEIESALASRRADDLQELAVSLAAAYAGIGGDVNLTDIQQAMRGALSREYNSLLSVARVNDNTLRVRIGARQTGSAPADARSASYASESYELTAQTHNISLLVLVPACLVASGEIPLYFGSHTIFLPVSGGPPVRDDESDLAGIQDRLYRAFGSEYREIVGGAAPPPGSSEERVEKCVLYRAALAAQNSDYGSFVKGFGAEVAATDVGRLNRLWMEMTERRIGSAYDSGRFTLPPYPSPQPIAKEQLVLLSDDGKQTTAIVAGDASRLDPRRLGAIWHVPLKAPADAKQPTAIGAGSYDLPASDMTAAPDHLTLLFPSLQAVGAVPDLGSKLEVVQDGTTKLLDSSHVLYSSKAAGAPSGKLLGTFIIDRVKLAPDQKREDTPTLALIFDDAYVQWLDTNEAKQLNEKRFPLLSIVGAGIKSPPAALVQDKKDPTKYRVTQSGTFQLTVDGLVPKSQVTFAIIPPDKGNWKAPDPIIRTVDALPK